MPSQPNQPPGQRPTRVKRLWSAIKSTSRWTEKRAIEPFANYLDQADIFRIVEKLSPVIEAIGIIAIPLVIWFATQSAQEAKDESEKAARAQEAVKNYLNQLSTVFLDGNLEKDERLRTVTRASTLALLNDPNLDGNRKGQVVEYLTELKLVQVEEADKRKEEAEPLISLASSNFSGAKLNWAKFYRADLREANFIGAKLEGTILNKANLSRANLSKADLSRAKLNGANLFAAKLRVADLTGAELNGANLTETELNGANLRWAHLIAANLEGADLSGAELMMTHLKWANLEGADLNGANLYRTDLRGANLYNAKISWGNLTWGDLGSARLCKTRLPDDVIVGSLDPNRDCKEFGITP
jgi:uncharacterized protein YjbI with pentapeptide repeats